jgi:transcriptional regulator with XRE-family HTH domain
VLIGEVLKEVRKGKKMSQGDIENRTGLIRAYVSRVENGHTIPNLFTLEKFARALDVPLWQIIRGTVEGPTPSPIVERRKVGTPAGVKNDVRRIEQEMIKMPPKNRQLLVEIARRMVRRGN